MKHVILLVTDYERWKCLILTSNSYIILVSNNERKTHFRIPYMVCTFDSIDWSCTDNPFIKTMFVVKVMIPACCVLRAPAHNNKVMKIVN